VTWWEWPLLAVVVAYGLSVASIALWSVYWFVLGERRYERRRINALYRAEGKHPRYPGRLWN